MFKTPRLKSKVGAIAEHAVLEYLTQVEKLLDIKECTEGGRRKITVGGDWIHAASAYTRTRVINVLQNTHTLRWAITNRQEEDCLRTVKQIASDLPKVTRSVRRLYRTGFQHGHFRVVIMNRLGAYHTREILRGIDEASNLLQNRFPQVLYGDLYLTPGYKGNVGGSYTASDSILLSPKGKTLRQGFHLHTVLHELGHRYDFQFWKNDTDRKAFNKLSVEGKIAVTPYGGKNPQENFAEAFAHYALGKPLHPEIQAIMDRLE